MLARQDAQASAGRIHLITYSFSDWGRLVRFPFDGKAPMGCGCKEKSRFKPGTVGEVPARLYPTTLNAGPYGYPVMFSLPSSVTTKISCSR